MSNIKLKVRYLNPNVECVNLWADDVADYALPCLEDDFLGIERTPTFEVYISNNKTLDCYWIEAGLEHTFEMLQNGFDKKIGGLYDIPEWGLYDLTAGEAVLHAWIKANGTRSQTGWWKDKLAEGCKQLKRGDEKFKDLFKI